MGHAAVEAESVREELIAMLPRLRRFAAVLAGTRPQRDDLLRDACLRMMEEQHRYPLGTDFDRWAYAEIYRLWLERLRAGSQPPTHGPGGEADFAYPGSEPEFGLDDAEATAFLASLTPQQRCALLLVHGEHFSYEDSAKVLDTSVQTVVARVTRASVQLADRMSEEPEGARSTASTERLRPEGVEEKP